MAMNAAHLHIILNHFPVIGLVFTAAVLAAALLQRSEELARVGAVCLVFLALVALPVYLTGEPAEEVVEHLPGISGQTIERHEEAATVALVLIEALGVIALGGLVAFRRQGTLPRWLAALLFALALVGMGWAAWTSYLGGQVSHPEARPGFEAAED
jgi:uncharacterized membrane protein